MKLRNTIFCFGLLACILPLSSCNRSKTIESNIQSNKTQEDDKEKKDEKEQIESTETFSEYSVKLKSGTKTLKGSVDVSHENESLFHIDIKPDAQASLFQPDVFGPEKLMVVQVINPGSVYEYMIIPLDVEKPKVEKTFRTFNEPPEIVKGPKNGEFTVVFLEPFPDSGARPIAPTVALKYKKGKFTLDTEIMKERGKEALLGDVQSIKDAFDVHEDSNEVPPELIDEVVNRFYLGRATEARKFFDKAWPKNRKGKSDAWQTIIEQMKQSPYWSQIKAMN